MAELIHGRKFGIELCKALGLNPARVHDLIVEVRADDMVMVQVRRYLDAEEGGLLKEEIEKYHLVEHEEGVE